MKSDALNQIDGVAIYPIISFLIFFTFFLLLLVYVIKADKGFIDKMSHMPLADDDVHGASKSSNHE